MNNIMFNPILAIRSKSYIYTITYNFDEVFVTGFWKTDRIVTRVLFHFIGPANGYTCTLHIHSAITTLG